MVFTSLNQIPPPSLAIWIPIGLDVLRLDAPRMATAFIRLFLHLMIQKDSIRQPEIQNGCSKCTKKWMLTDKMKHGLLFLDLNQEMWLDQNGCSALSKILMAQLSGIKLAMWLKALHGFWASITLILLARSSKHRPLELFFH